MSGIYECLEIIERCSPVKPYIAAVGPGVNPHQRIGCSRLEEHVSACRAHIDYDIGEARILYFLHVGADVFLAVGIVCEICRGINPHISRLADDPVILSAAAIAVTAAVTVFISFASVSVPLRIPWHRIGLFPARRDG